VLADRDLVVGRLDPDPERLEGVDHVLADLLGEVGREVEVAGLVVGQRLDPPSGPRRNRKNSSSGPVFTT
jgi:hypothetical protein